MVASLQNSLLSPMGSFIFGDAPLSTIATADADVATFLDPAEFTKLVLELTYSQA